MGCGGYDYYNSSFKDDVSNPIDHDCVEISPTINEEVKVVIMLLKRNKVVGF